MHITVQPVDQDAVRQFDLSSDQRGLLVTGVTPGGPAYGTIADPDNGGPDIILELEGKPLKTAAVSGRPAVGRRRSGPRGGRGGAAEDSAGGGAGQLKNIPHG